MSDPTKGTVVITTDNLKELDDAVWAQRNSPGRLAYFYLEEEKPKQGKKNKPKVKPLESYEAAIKILGGTIPFGIA